MFLDFKKITQFLYTNLFIFFRCPSWPYKKIKKKNINNVLGFKKNHPVRSYILTLLSFPDVQAGPTKKLKKEY